MSIDIVAGGLGASGAPSVGGFNLDLVFDPGFVSFVSTTFGPFLGAGATDLSDFLGPPPPGTVNAAQVAGFLTLPGDLDALQSDTIVLATMSFTVGPAASGSSTLTVGPAGINGLIGPPLADGLGFELAVDSFTGTTLTVPAREASAPGSLALTALALAGLGAIRRRTCART